MDDSVACIMVQAVDDLFIEDEEAIVIAATPANSLDSVVGNTTVNIMDNNGMCTLVVAITVCYNNIRYNYVSCSSL